MTLPGLSARFERIDFKFNKNNVTITHIITWDDVIRLYLACQQGSFRTALIFKDPQRTS